MIDRAREEGVTRKHPMRQAVATLARVLPCVWGLLLMVVLGGACGRSVFSKTSDSTATATPSPGSGTFLYVTNNDGTVGEFTRSTTTGVLTFIGTVKAGNASGPFGLTAVSSSNNNVYVANTAGGVHQFSFNATSGKLTALNPSSVKAGTNPRWVATDSTDAFAYATNFGSASISQYKIGSSNGALTANGTATGPLANPYAAISSGNSLFVSDRANSGTIVTFSINTSTGTLGSPTTAPMVFSGTGMPGPMVIDPSSQFLYVTDVNSGTVSLLSGVSAGTLTLVQVYPSTSPGTPSIGLAITAPSSSSNEFLYTANQSAGTISLYVVSPATGALTLPAVVATGLSNPTGLAVDPFGAFLYVTNQTTGNISTYSINATTGTLTVVGSPIPTETSNSNSTPLFMAFGG